MILKAIAGLHKKIDAIHGAHMVAKHGLDKMNDPLHDGMPPEGSPEEEASESPAMEDKEEGSELPGMNDQDDEEEQGKKPGLAIGIMVGKAKPSMNKKAMALKSFADKFGHK